MNYCNKNTFFFVCILILYSNTFCKNILHQPIIGHVTQQSAQLFFFSDSIISVSIHLSNENKIEKVFDSRTSDSIYYTNKIELNNLKPNVIYQYLIFDEERNKLAEGSFTTFNTASSLDTFSFCFGSCTKQTFDDSIFLTMAKHKPSFFLHLGDWLYNEYNSTTQLNDAISMQKLREQYIKRYNMPNLSNLLKYTPIDYIFDDEDGIYDDFSASTYNQIQANKKSIELKEIKYADSLKQILKQSWHQFFPSYTTKYSQEVYHQFSCGNADFFFIDNRSTRSSVSEIFYQNKKGKWKYKANSQHQLLDSLQLQFLLDGLKNSNADWKFIVSGITFNKSYKKVFDICMKLQKKILPNQKSGMYIAASLASMWFAYPNTQAKLLNYCKENDIKNVIILSGDAHSAAIDDGKNAGFPEIMAGALAQENSEIASIIYNNFRLKTWNKGGQGIRNNNFNAAFGKVTVNADNNVQLEIIDKQNNIIASHLVKNNFVPKKVNEKKQSKITFGNKLNVLKNKIKIGFHHIFTKKNRQ
jgi:alkaline phosphatase D